MAATKRRSHKAEEDALAVAVFAANAAVGTRKWFVCADCNKLCLGQGLCRTTSKFGHEKLFCGQCIEYCVVCCAHFAPSMSYVHADCETRNQ